MQNLKKYGLFLLLAVFVASAAIVPAHAQDARVAANVPFDFAVGSHHFQAGSYRIQSQSLGTFVSFSDDGGKSTYTLMNRSGNAALHNGQPYLVFNQYGKESFLTKIVFSDDRTYVVPRSSREKEILARPRTVEQMEVTTGGTR